MPRDTIVDSWSCAFSAPSSSPGATTQAAKARRKGAAARARSEVFMMPSSHRNPRARPLAGLVKHHEEA
jgi:hypothetical protein